MHIYYILNILFYIVYIYTYYIYIVYICGYVWWSSGDIIMNQWDWTNWRTPRDARLGKKLVRKLAKRSWSIWLGQGDPAVASWWNTGFSCAFLMKWHKSTQFQSFKFSIVHHLPGKGLQILSELLPRPSSFVLLPPSSSSQQRTPDLRQHGRISTAMPTDIWCSRLRSGWGPAVPMSERMSE